MQSVSSKRFGNRHVESVKHRKAFQPLNVMPPKPSDGAPTETIIFYRIETSHVVIVRVIHGARDHAALLGAELGDE